MACGASMAGIAGCGSTEERGKSEDDNYGSEDGESDTNEQGGNNTEREEGEVFDDISNSDLLEYSSIQLSTADLPSGYNLAGEEETIVHDLSEAQRNGYLELGIRFLHERAFTFDNESLGEPDTIFSSIVVYDTIEDVENGRRELQQLVEEEGGWFSEPSIEGVDAAFVGQYDTTDLNNAVAYVSMDSIEIYVVVSDTEEQYQHKAINLTRLFRNRVWDTQG